MNQIQVRRLIEEIITMPTAEIAAQYVQANLRSVLDPVCFQVITQMLLEEQKAHGVTFRYKVLTRLSEYTSVLFRRQMLDNVTTRDVTEALPELLVLKAVNIAEADNTVENGWDFKPDSFDSWWEILNPVKSDRMASLTVEEDHLLDDIAIHKLLISIDNRLISALKKISDTRESVGVAIREVEEIVKDCDRLLTKAQPKYYQLDTSAVHRKKADAFKYIASAYDRLGNAEQAKFYFQRAVDDFIQLNKKREADRCLADMAWVEFKHEGDFNTAYQRLHAILETVSQDPVDQAEYLLELGQMCSANGDDYQARELLERAERKLGYQNPSGTQLADALTQSLLAFMTGQSLPAEMSIVTQNRVRSLYRQLYKTLQEIYIRSGDYENASQYTRLLQEMDGKIEEGNKLNLEFSQEMSSRLTSIFEQYDKFITGDQEP